MFWLIQLYPLPLLLFPLPLFWLCGCHRLIFPSQRKKINKDQVPSEKEKETDEKEEEYEKEGKVTNPKNHNKSNSAARQQTPRKRGN